MAASSESGEEQKDIHSLTTNLHDVLMKEELERESDSEDLAILEPAIDPASPTTPKGDKPRPSRQDIKEATETVELIRRIRHGHGELTSKRREVTTFSRRVHAKIRAHNLASVPKIAKQLGPPVVIMEDVWKKYALKSREDAVVAVRGVSLHEDALFKPICKGEFVMIRGPSGGGKTTILNILGMIDEPTHGEVTVLGHRVDHSSNDSFLSDLRLRKVGFVFQTFNLLATMSAFENVELPMTILGHLSPKKAKHRALDLLKLVGLADRVEHLPSELSGGEQQRVTVARALANEPEILLLDEPTGDLDTRNTVDIMNLILDVNLKCNVTCILVTHNPDLECYADRILYVEDGKLKKQAINNYQMRLNFAHYMKHMNQETSEASMPE